MYNEKLINLREAQEIRQKDISKILNIQFTTYNDYETERNIIPLKHLNTLCNYFNISIDYMFNLTNIKKYPNLKNNNDKSLFGERLKEFRKENNLTQEKLAQFLNTSQSNIVKYEQGKSMITTAFLYAICKKYKVSADYLLCKVDYPKYLK